MLKYIQWLLPVERGTFELQGHNARPANIAIVLEAFKDGLQKQGKL